MQRVIGVRPAAHPSKIDCYNSEIADDNVSKPISLESGM